jgi:uncharacterized metal-binding protein
MSNEEQKATIKFNTMNHRCPIGETTGQKNISESKIPVLSCEGACIRGEIARLAANIVSKQDQYARGCHGELISVPESAIARWIKEAEKVVIIDGCFLKCHGRIIENIIDKNKMIQFDALSSYKKYTDIFDHDDVPEQERKEVAQSVANWVIESLNNSKVESSSSSCCRSDDSKSGCCG